MNSLWLNVLCFIKDQFQINKVLNVRRSIQFPFVIHCVQASQSFSSVGWICLLLKPLMWKWKNLLFQIGSFGILILIARYIWLERSQGAYCMYVWLYSCILNRWIQWITWLLTEGTGVYWCITYRLSWLYAFTQFSVLNWLQYKSHK